MLISLLYVSHSTMNSADAGDQVDAIVAVARQRNPILNVSGALVFTETHFAQVLEGSPQAIDELMTSVSADKRHDNVDVVRRTEINERCFADWAMAYSGPSSYVASHLRPLLGGPSAPLREIDAAEQLINVMQEFVC